VYRLEKLCTEYVKQKDAKHKLLQKAINVDAKVTEELLRTTLLAERVFCSDSSYDDFLQKAPQKVV